MSGTHGSVIGSQHKLDVDFGLVSSLILALQLQLTCSLQPATCSALQLLLLFEHAHDQVHDQVITSWNRCPTLK